MDLRTKEELEVTPRFGFVPMVPVVTSLAALKTSCTIALSQGEIMPLTRKRRPKEK